MLWWVWAIVMSRDGKNVSLCFVWMFLVSKKWRGRNGFYASHPTSLSYSDFIYICISFLFLPFSWPSTLFLSSISRNHFIKDRKMSLMCLSSYLVQIFLIKKRGMDRMRRRHPCSHPVSSYIKRNMNYNFTNSKKIKLINDWTLYHLKFKKFMDRLNRKETKCFL